MSDDPNHSHGSCCPELETDNVCDTLDFHYRLTHPTSVSHNNQRVLVELVIHARVERCPGPMTLGNLVYSTTLFPGEKVRLFSTDRRTRYSMDSSSQLSYRNEQTSEEQLYMSSMNDFMSDVTVRDESRASSSSKGSAEGRASASGALQSFFGGPSVSASGSYSASSTSDFLRELHQHAESSHNRSEEVTRAANSVSIGEVQTRSHAEGETEDHFESASRVFSNPNHCHAITFYFYQINKTQTVRFTIESIRRRVIDPAADTVVTNNRFLAAGQVEVIPNAVLATNTNRLEVEEVGRVSAAAANIRQEERVTDLRTNVRLATAAPVFQFEPMPAKVRDQALDEVDRELVANKLIAAPRGDISEEMRQSLSIEIVSSLPTPGMLVKGCLDDCNICEEEVQQDVQLNLQRKQLENELLRRRIELLDQSQEYRCCPEDETPSEG